MSIVITVNKRIKIVIIINSFSDETEVLKCYKNNSLVAHRDNFKP